jgi:hypothetical protein
MLIWADALPMDLHVLSLLELIDMILFDQLDLSLSCLQLIHE